MPLHIDDTASQANLAAAAAGAAHNADAGAHGDLFASVRESFKQSYEGRGIAATATSAALIVPAVNAAQDFGSTNWSLKLPVIVLPTWAPDADVVLFSNVAANVGVRISLRTSGLIRVQFGNGTNLTTHDFATTAPVQLDTYAGAEFVLVCDRHTSLVIYCNGAAVGTPVTISSALSQTLTGGAWYVLSDGSTNYAGFAFESLAKGSAILSADEVMQRFRNPYLWKSGLVGAGIFTSNFATADSWTVARATAEYNQSIAGSAGWAKVTGDATDANTHLFYRTIPTTSAGATLRLRCKLYIPSSNAVMKGVEIRTTNGATLANILYDVTGAETADTVVNVDVAVPATASATSLRVYMQDATGVQQVPFTGDIFYIKDISLVEVGPQINCELANAGPQKPDSVVSQHAYTLCADTERVNDFRLRGAISWAASNGAKPMVADVALFAASIDQLEIWAKSTSGGYFVIGDGSDVDRYFAEAVIPTAWTKLTLARSVNDGTNLKLIARPMDGSGGAETRTDTLSLVIVARRLSTS